MRGKLAVALFVFTLLVLLSGCASSSAADGEAKLSISGSSTLAPLVAELARLYEKDHPGVRIDVHSGGSARGIADVRNGLADLGMVSRSLKESENDLLAFPLARDGIALIVHGDNPIGELEPAQIKAIYTGQISRWSEVGGRDRPITVVTKAEGRSTLELFLEHFALESTDIKASVVIGDNEQGMKTVTGNPDAIGYVSVGSAEHAVSQAAPLRLLPLEGVAATSENVRSAAFPLARQLTLVAREQPEGAAADFLEFMRGPEAIPVIEEFFFVPLG